MLFAVSIFTSVLLTEVAPCPTIATVEHPINILTNDAGRVVADFGLDAFGWLEFDAPCQGDYFVVLGEKLTEGGQVERGYAQNVRAVGAKWRIEVPGIHRVPLAPDMRNSFAAKEGSPIPVKREFGVVMPFRAVEFFETPFQITKDNVRRQVVTTTFNRNDSAFRCDSSELCRVYELCRHTMYATSFAGMFVDGDRERIPYEADAYVSQLNWYAISSNAAYPRASIQYLIRHPTWPTEFRMCTILSVWADWMWTGDTAFIKQNYEFLKNEHLFLHLRRPDGLLVSGGERLPGVTTNRVGVADIVDWPVSERDDFEFRDVNAVVNAFHYKSLERMSELATAIGNYEDAANYDTMAKDTRNSFNRTFFDNRTGLYVDGEGSSHSSIHVNAIALAFGLVPMQYKTGIADWLVSRGMACSVYFSQYLLEALYECGRSDAALKLLTAKGNRSWLGMLYQGATMTMEAWNMEVKPNMDWNHSWGAVPLNIITQHLLGVTPMEPGYNKIAIRPQISALNMVEAHIPIKAGILRLSIKDGCISGETPVPAYICWQGKKEEVQKGNFKVQGRGGK